MDPNNDVNSSPIVLHEDNVHEVVTSRVSDFSTTSRKKASKSKKKIKCDEEDVSDIAFWSAAKRQSWAAIETNPNAFYYRHVAPGQTKRTGAWDEREKKLFMETIKIHPPSQGKWGLFAQHIPGRVGYQCRNFYHRLLESGELTALPEELEKMQRPRKKAPKPKKAARRHPKVESDSESEEPVDLESDDDAPPEHLEVEEPAPVHDVVPPEPFREVIVQPEPVHEVVQPEPFHEIAQPEPFHEVVAQPEPVHEVVAQPRWNPRTKEPWKTLTNWNPQQVLRFPVASVLGESEKVEYESARILKVNQEDPLNMIVLSFPAPPHRRSEFVNAVRQRLACGSEAERQELLGAYLRVMDEMGNLPGDARMEASNRFVDFVVHGARV